MEAIIQMAARLGNAVASSPQATALRDAMRELDDQPEVRKLLDEFQVHSRKVAELQAENKPIEVEDKHKLQELQGQLIGQEIFKKYTAAQVEYVDLMRKVNEELQHHMAGADGDGG